MKFQDIDAPNTNNPKKPNLVVILLYCNLVGAKSALSTVHTHSKRLTTKDLAKSGPFLPPVDSRSDASSKHQQRYEQPTNKEMDSALGFCPPMAINVKSPSTKGKNHDRKKGQRQHALEPRRIKKHEPPPTLSKKN